MISGKLRRLTGFCVNLANMHSRIITERAKLILCFGLMTGLFQVECHIAALNSGHKCRGFLKNSLVSPD